MDSTKLLLATCLILLLLLIRSCTHQCDPCKFTSTRFDDSSTIVTQAQIIANNESIAAIQAAEIAALELELNNPVEVVKFKTRTVIKTEFKVGDTVIIERVPHLRLPLKFYKAEKFWVIGGQLTTKGNLQIDSLIMNADFTYAVGDTIRKGLFKRRDKVIRMRIDNPNMQITGMNNIYIKQEKKWYQTTAFKVGVGALIGFGVSRAAQK
jgi:hypothetical protein